MFHWGLLWLLQPRITFYSCHHRRVLSETEINTSKWKSENQNILNASVGRTKTSHISAVFHLLLFCCRDLHDRFLSNFAVHLRSAGGAENAKRSWKSVIAADKRPFLPLILHPDVKFWARKTHEHCYTMEMYMAYSNLIYGETVLWSCKKLHGSLVMQPGGTKNILLFPLKGYRDMGFWQRWCSLSSSHPRCHYFRKAPFHFVIDTLLAVSAILGRLLIFAAGSHKAYDAIY